MADYATKKREEEAPQVAPTQGQTDVMARLREAKISRAEPPKVTEDTRSKMLQGFCTDFFTACYDKAKKEGTTNAFNGSEMKQCFG